MSFSDCFTCGERREITQFLSKLWMPFGLSIIMLCGIFGRYTLIFYQRNFDVFVVRRALPFPPNKVFFSFVCFFFIQIIHEPGCANFIESRALFQSSRGCNCKLNTVAWLVELKYGHVVFICEELVGWPWEGAFHCKGTNTKSDRVG